MLPCRALKRALRRLAGLSPRRELSWSLQFRVNHGQFGSCSLDKKPDSRALACWRGIAAVGADGIPRLRGGDPSRSLSRKSCEEFGRPSGTETVEGSRSQGSRPLSRTSPWAILDRFPRAEGRGVWRDFHRLQWAQVPIRTGAKSRLLVRRETSLSAPCHRAPLLENQY